MRSARSCSSSTSAYEGIADSSPIVYSRSSDLSNETSRSRATHSCGSGWRTGTRGPGRGVVDGGSRYSRSQFSGGSSVTSNRRLRRNAAAARHATAPGCVRLACLTGHTGGLLWEVSDSLPKLSHERAARPEDEGGRGLQLLASASHRWGTRPGAPGETVWFELSVPR